jgi:tripartite-type tricarboxylate transporter receptor subunit TctC
VLADPETQTALTEQGMTPIGNAPDAFANAINEELAKWGKVIVQRKLTIN